ncbi:alpha/beta hydrolase [Sphingomonas sp. DT-51]|uniref:alpha/beta hydrolase n=1 Tax=Sphingomonas sp. DT-51 TaxID=3396165 RepID=UPI003F1D2F1B
MMTQTAAAQTAADPATDVNLDPRVRAFLSEVNKSPSPFWELPQPQPQDALTALQNKTQVDMSGVTTTSRTISENGRQVKIHIMKPDHNSGTPGVLLFIHGGVWIIGNFDNHKRLLRDLVLGSGQVGVFVEYSPLPAAKFPTQLEESYAVLQWISKHGRELGADGTRVAVAGNSVGGNMTAALSLMTKDRAGPKIDYQVLLVPATDASVDTASYHEFSDGYFLSRGFMKYGWDRYAPEERDDPYVAPLRAGAEKLKGLPPALVVTAQSDPLRDEGEEYARKLMAAGVDVTAVRYDGTIHDFVALNALRNVPSTVAALDQISAGIRTHIGG